MSDTRDCPLCGEQMRLHEMPAIDRVPGTSQIAQRIVREWRCPECDYFEEVEEPPVKP